MHRHLPGGLQHQHDDIATPVARTLTQYAPWPSDLEVAVKEFRYPVDGSKPWRFWLSDEPRDFADAKRTVPIAGGLTFNIGVPCRDAYHPENDHYPGVHHSHPVPAATFKRAVWERWMFDRLMDTIRHEAAENAVFVYDEAEIPEDAEGKGRPASHHERRPFAPTHGPGDDPYVLHEYATDEQARTSFRGIVKQ